MDYTPFCYKFIFLSILYIKLERHHIQRIPFTYIMHETIELVQMKID